MQYLTISLFAILASGLISTPVQAQSISFVDGIWINQDTITTNDTTRVYVALRNSTSFDITGTLALYADEVFVGSTTVAALPGRLIESWVDWQPQQTGSYQLTATITNISPTRPDEDQATPTLTLSRVVVTDPLPKVATSSPNETLDVGQAQNIDNQLQEHFANQGFEQFITSSIPRQWLETASQQIETIHHSLADYERHLRDRRQQNAATSTSTEENASEINQTQESSHSATTTVGALVFTPIIDWFKTNLNNLYIHTISGLRWLFSHPIIIQIVFLLLLLWFIYRTVRYFGKRYQ